jgi:hypothetical protein
MKTDNALTIIEQIQNADFYSIYFVTLILMPIILAVWITILKNIGLPISKVRQSTFLLIGLYLLSVIVLKFGTSKEKDYEIGSKRIKSYLKANNWELIGLQRIVDNIDAEYDAKFINSLAKNYPSDFSIVALDDPFDPKGLKYLGDKQVEQKGYEIGKNRITKYLNGFPEGQRFSGFNMIREYVDSRYDNYFLEELIMQYPDSLKRTNLTDKNDRIGIKLPGN